MSGSSLKVGRTDDLDVIAAGLGQMCVGTAGTVLTVYGLGSCIGLFLWWPRGHIGVACHIVLPNSGGNKADPAAPAKYADHAVPAAVQALVSKGAGRSELVAKLAGGAQVLAIGAALETGRQNAEKTIDGLRAVGVDVAGRHVGGHVGRTARFDPQSGLLEVRPTHGKPVTI